MRFVLLSIFASLAIAGDCNESELALWNGNMDFTETMRVCAVKNMGMGGKVTQCLNDAYAGELSWSCANCFGKTVECGRQNCAVRCMADSGSADCLKCTEENGCVKLQNDCTGFEIGPLPPVSLEKKKSSDEGSAFAQDPSASTATLQVVVSVSVAVLMIMSF